MPISAYGGASEAFQDIMAYRGQQREAAYSEQREKLMGQEEQMNELSLNQAKHEEQQRQEEQKRGERLINVNNFMEASGFSPETTKIITDQIMQEGYGTLGPSGNVLMKAKYKDPAMKSIDGNAQLLHGAAQMEINFLKPKIDAMKQQMQNPKMKPEEQQKLATQLKSLQDRLMMMDQLGMSAQEKLEKMKAESAQTVARIGAAGRIGAAKIGAQSKAEQTEYESWQTRDGKIVNLRKGQAPPQGSIKVGTQPGGDVAMPGPASGQMPPFPGPSGSRNDQALTALPANERGIAKSLAEYKIPWPGSFALRNPKWSRIINAAEQYNPSFDYNQYVARQRLMVDFRSGASSKNIRSLNTAVGHLQTLKQKADALENSSLQLWNAIANRGLNAVGDKRVAEFNMAANAVEGELATVFKGTAGTDQEIKAWRDNLSYSQSPQQLKGAIDTAIELMGSRLGAIRDQYQAGMGEPANFPILSNRARGILKGLGTNVDQLDPITSKDQSQATPSPKGSKPSKADWMKQAKPANPGVSNTDLENYYTQKYGQ